MKRKDKILETARQLFNVSGVNAISLKTIAGEMGISYGNVTYHYPTKEPLVLQLYHDFRQAHQVISQNFALSDNLLKDILEAPAQTFEISLDYRFLFSDFVEVLRSYPQISIEQKQLQKMGTEAFLPMFGQLKEQGLFRKEIDDNQIRYLMELSGIIRTFFFMNQVPTVIADSNLLALKKSYIQQVNQLLYPYLTAGGIVIYEKIDLI